MEDNDKSDLTLFDDHFSARDDIILFNDTVVNASEESLNPIHSSSPIDAVSCNNQGSTEKDKIEGLFWREENGII